MNITRPLHAISRILYSQFLRYRLRLPRQKCREAMSSSAWPSEGINKIIVINLDTHTERFAAVRRELGCIVDADGKSLAERTIRYSACDARWHDEESSKSVDIEPFYTLQDQLLVEPQPRTVPDSFELARPIRMSEVEVAVARSHVDVWKFVAESDFSYVLVLEDDVWFERRFGRLVDQAWGEMKAEDGVNPTFDVLYLSYKEVRHGAPKEIISRNMFRPERGLWYMSGYVLSRKGARKLVRLLPCRGPVDLWINRKFREIDVRALRRSVIRQRLDLKSTNLYSIIPTLCRIGVLDGEYASLFHQSPIQTPLFAFGMPGAGLSSLAMALSMLGYRCCSDLDQIPDCELNGLLAGRSDRVFDAYVNIGSLTSHVRVLMQRYPRAKIIVVNDTAHTGDGGSMLLPDELEEGDVLRLDCGETNQWRALCEYLRVAPPSAPYPTVQEIGQRGFRMVESFRTRPAKRLQHDPSPWAVEPRVGWSGIGVSACAQPEASASSRACFRDDLSDLWPARWLSRNDTFPGNLALFRAANVIPRPDGGLLLAVKEEPLGVRDLSAGAISSGSSFLFGRFEVILQATQVPGLVTGFFLHRDSPRQEIDIEITGNRPDRLLVNVFYNPGSEGAKFDYGYRGTPFSIGLGFDASSGLHQFAIEWDPCEIRWLVDDELVHRRAVWGPTPIPHLPMTLHVNTWPTRSRELAGRLARGALPASVIVRQIAVDAFTGIRGAD